VNRAILVCFVLAGCASAGGGSAPDASQGGPPDAEVTPPDADTSPDADGCIPMTEVCDGDDDDCDDIADNGCACTNGATQPCYTGNVALVGHGVCAQGVQTCVDGAWSATCAGQVLPTTETCNNLDDDCDDTPDDGNPGGGACSTGLTGICAAGTRTCSGGTLSGCVQNMSPTTELCNGLDDDCNAGTADGSAEAWYGAACDGADVDVCVEGTFTCSAAHTQTCSDATGDSNRVQDGGYEASLGSTTYWAQASTNFGTPLCDTTCNSPGGTYAARTGTIWNWLGGISNTAETASTTQTLVIPTGTATLTYYLSIPACAAAGGADTFSVLVDGNVLFSTTNADASCGSTAYVLKSLNVSAYANGLNHTLQFRGVFVTGHTAGTLTNFFVDDIRLEGCP
jgi:hypothetical protein